jgi:hypothetical protein
MEAIAKAAPDVYQAADAMKDHVASGNPLPQGASLYMDLLTWAIDLVNWDEIAEACCASMPEQTGGDNA